MNYFKHFGKCPPNDNYHTTDAHAAGIIIIVVAGTRVTGR